MAPTSGIYDFFLLWKSLFKSYFTEIFLCQLEKSGSGQYSIWRNKICISNIYGYACRRNQIIKRICNE